MKNFKYLPARSLLFLLTACGVVSSKSSTPAPEVYSLDGVKLVSSSVSDASDPSSMTQMTYAISSQSRLLLRLENFSEKVDQVSLASGNEVGVDVVLNQESDLSSALSSFQLCPIVKNWMMLATWQSAYPMGSSGLWSRAGVDYDSSACVSGTQLTVNSITFDMTTWFKNYVKGRSENFGLVLISSNASAIAVKGDQDAAASPRIHWIKNASF